TDPRNLYDETIGIFTNYMMYGWEREAQFSYFGIDGLIFQQNIGIRVRGSSTRDGEQKSLTLYAREQYSNSKTFEHSFFDTDTNAFILRIRPIAQKEGFISSLVADRDVAVQEYQMANLYINQEYFGIYAFMNRVDTDFLGNKYNVDSDDIEYIKIGHIFALPEENMEGYQQFLAYEDYWTNTDMSIEDNYLQACEYVDMQSLIDYYAIQIYINNVDFSYKKNTLLWKTKNVADGEYSDGRWRYGLFDLDFSIYFALDDTEWTYDFDFFTGDQPYVSPLYEDPVFMSLMKSQEFRQRFYDSFVEIAETNFNPERVRALLDAQPYQVNNDIIAEFFDQRPLYIFDDLDAFMENYEAYYTTSEEPIAKPAVEPKDESIIDTIKESETLLVGLPVFLLMLVWLIIAYWRKYGDSSRSKKGNE
ncbi:MAG TPA: CotH kinase family protein, partial [Bacillota bacterium]|nr:CotH kinase family protein [Bacillota bacterium]